MKYYRLEAVKNGKPLSVKKKFSTRQKAVDYAIDKIYSYGYCDQVESIIERSNKHDLEYVCNPYNRFFVSRKIVVA